ncbi:hypothetical protein ACS2E9_27280 [Bacillus cereus group sp. BceL215]|uniref:hypothetical protein n=1 Tax=Bacillus cereus group sp. BceL215 TaxID=3445015 RepID=UPI003F2246A0
MVVKYSISTKNEDVFGISAEYIDENYRAITFVDIQSGNIIAFESFDLNGETLKGFAEIMDEVSNEVKDELNIKLAGSTLSTTKEKFYQIVEEKNMTEKYILKIKETFPLEVVKMLVG